MEERPGSGTRATTLALTLLRSTGMLSRLGMALPTPPGRSHARPSRAPRCSVRVEVRYALAVDGDDPYRLADDVLDPLLTTGSFGGGDRPARGSALEVRGAEVSAVVRQGGRVEVRVFNPAPRPTTVEIAGPLGLARRPTRASRRSVRGLLRAPALGDRHRPARRRLSRRRRRPRVRTPRWTTCSPRSRSSSSSRSTPANRSHRMFRRRSAPGSAPARDSFHTWTRPMSFRFRVRRARSSNRPRPAIEPAPGLGRRLRLGQQGGVELLRGQDGPGIGHVHQPAGQVDHRAVEVAVLDQHGADGQGHPDVGEQVVAGVGLGQAQPDARPPRWPSAPRT